MSSNSSDTNLINTLNNLTPGLNRYLSIIIFLFGTIGNLLNCLALSQRILRFNPCSFLFLASSIASLITLISGVAVRLLAGWSADLTDTIAWLCKLRIFVLFTSRTIASWLIMLATFDRWLSSSLVVHHRQMVNLKNARRGIIAVVFLSCVVYAQIFYCYEANLTNAPLKCYGRTTWCRLLIDSEFTSISILLPSLLMFIFGFMTIKNLHQTALRRSYLVSMSLINESENGARLRQRSTKTDHYLRIMLCIQVILLTLFSLPQAIQNLYTNASRFQVKSPLQNAINNFIFNLFLLLTYVTNGMPFYIYTLTGGIVFRKALFDSIRKFIRKMTCRQK
jgi:hypothetical protein